MSDELDIYEAPVAVQPANLFGARDPAEVIARSSEAATALTQVIKDRHLFATIGDKSHVLVDGWTLLGSMMGVFPVVVWTRRVTEPAEGWEARVEARTLAGDVVGAAESECLKTEPRWKSAEDYAVRSMAQTRATSKALRGPLGFIVHLAGFSPTPAEEMPSKESSEPASVAMVSKEQHGYIAVLCEEIATATEQTKEKVQNDSRAWINEQFGKVTRGDLTHDEASKLIEHLKALKEAADVPFG